MLHLLYATGMRVSELVTLDLNDLDFERGAVRCVGRGSASQPLADQKSLIVLRDYLEREGRSSCARVLRRRRCS